MDARERPESTEREPGRRLTRRRLILGSLTGGVGLLAAGTAVGELADHGVLPVRSLLNAVDGACSAAAPDLRFGAPGPTRTGSFFSRLRGREVSYSIAYPPGHGPGSELALVVSLHGFGGNHASGLGGIRPADALAARRHGVALAPMAIVAVDGGGLYWNPHPGDNPQGMLVDELIPLCARLGLGGSPERVGVIGISMGGFGALALAERYPPHVGAIAAISPAVWTSYAQARRVNAGAFASAADFAADDVITHAGGLAGLPVRIASGTGDPFHPGVLALARVLPPSVQMHFAAGCHDTAFFAAQQHPSLGFLAEHLQTG